MKRAICAVALMGLAGCTTTVENRVVDDDLKSIAATGYTAVVPNTGIKVGRLYFSGEGKRPAFVTADGTVFNSLCYDDFSGTNALAEIGKYVVDEGVSVTKKTMVGGLNGSASVSISKVKALGTLAIGGDGSRNRTYVIEKVHTLTLTDAGLETVKNQIGSDCKKEIANLLNEKREVIVALSAQRAEKATDTRTIGAGGTVGASIGGTVTGAGGKVAVTGEGAGVGGGYSHVVTDEYELVFLSVRKTGL